MDAKELEKKIERYEKLAQKNYMIYQEVGEARYERAWKNYEELADVYRKAYVAQCEEDEARTRRLQNMSHFIKEHIEFRFKDNYTKSEVVELAETMKQFVI